MKSLLYPDSRNLLFPGGRILPGFYCYEEPSSCLITGICHVSVANRRKDMSGKAAEIKLTEKQHAILEKTRRSTTAPQCVPLGTSSAEANAAPGKAVFESWP